MVQVGIFGTTGALDDQTTHMLLNEIITQCCEKLGSQQVHRIISHASGFGIAEYALELGKLKGAETLGMVLPSCKGRTWYPEHGITYIKEDGSEMEVVDQSKIMDIVVWVGDFEPKEDWEKLSNLSEMKIMYVSDSMMDWCNTNTSLNCSKLVDQMLEI